MKLLKNILCTLIAKSFSTWPSMKGGSWLTPIGLLPDTKNCGLRMRRECRQRFPCHWLKKTLVSDPGMHHGTCVTNVPWCMPGLLNRGGGENVAGILGACATRNFMYLARGPLRGHLSFQFNRINWKSTDNCGLDDVCSWWPRICFSYFTQFDLFYLLYQDSTPPIRFWYCVDIVCNPSLLCVTVFFFLLPYSKILWCMF